MRIFFSFYVVLKATYGLITIEKGQVDDTFSDANKWTCQKCTYLNSISVYPKCILCDPSDSPLVNTSPDIMNTSISLAVPDRQSNDERNAEKLFQSIISYCQQNKINFVDDQFPPVSRSIGNMDHSFEWLRISEIALSSTKKNHHFKWTVYSSPEPNDIQQGQLGDCWLMAALALITERPEMLEHILLTKTINKEGVYLVRLCHNGLWKTVIVDDCFPCNQYRQLAYTQANRYQLYVPLIEKACAKLYGSYADLIGGQTEEGLQLLTGAPCDHIDLNANDFIFDKDIIWAKLLSACESHLLIGASTGRLDVNEEEYKRVHIHTNHAFSILAAHCLSNISMQFVLVRDPHAQTNYREELVTSSILNQLNSILPTHLPSGAFWISWPVFLRFFSSITISSYTSNNYDIREIGQFTQLSIESIPTFHFYLSETSSVNISLLYHRKNRRLPSYHTQSFILCNIKDRQLENIGIDVITLETRRGAFTHWTGLLKTGFYILLPFSTSFWDEKNHKFERDYTLVIHSKIQINGQIINEPATLLADCLIAYGLKNYSKISERKDFNYYATTGTSDFIMFIAENLSFTKYLNLDIDMSDGMYIRNARQSLITHDCIPPHHRQIIFLTEWTNEKNQKPNLNYVYQCSHVEQSNDSVPTINIFQNDFHSYRSF